MTLCRRLPVGWLSFGLPMVWTGPKLYEKSYGGHILSTVMPFTPVTQGAKMVVLRHFGFRPSVGFDITRQSTLSPTASC